MSKYSSYILYLLLSILVAILYVNDFGPMAHLQRSVNDTLCSLTAPTQAPSNVALVTIDQLAEKAYGPWPWNRDRIADLLAATAGAEPKAIFLNIELPENASQDSMGYNDTLAGQMSWVHNLVLPYDITLANFRSTKTSNPKYLFKNSVTIDNPVGVMGETSSLNVRKVFLPAEKLLANNPYLGFDYSNPDDDRVLRYQPVCMNYEGYYYPAASVLAAAAYLGVRTDQIKIVEHKEITLGNQRSVPINDRGEYFVNFTKGNSFAKYSAAKVLGANFDFSLLKDRLVLIGVDDPQNADVYKTAVASNTSDLAVKATVAENIINNNFLTIKDRSPLADMLILFGLGAVCAFLLPRLALKYRLLVPAGLLVVLFIFDYLAASSFRTLHQTAYIGLQLILFVAASPMLDMQMLSAGAPTETKKATRKKVPKVKVEKTSQTVSSTADCVPVREIKASAVDPENQKTVAMDYEEESKKFPRPHEEADDNVESTRATSSDGTETQHGETAEHGSQPLEHNALLDENIRGSSDSDKWQDSSDSGVRPSSQELTLTPEQSELKSLGRYQITGVLGRGAMGMVYKGIDPAINRPVALKTIRLDFVNDP
ncbi:MAG TPA: CHASE2 domain-containing protein, partial [Candidatus Acidoferrum sp.]|nr:CHASE2 domain-containing protein [Candidatus Acidoferrum sp.]